MLYRLFVQSERCGYRYYNNFCTKEPIENYNIALITEYIIFLRVV